MNKEKKTVALINEFIREKIRKLEKRIEELEFRIRDYEGEINKLEVINETLQDDVYHYKTAMKCEKHEWIEIPGVKEDMSCVHCGICASELEFKEELKCVECGGKLIKETEEILFCENCKMMFFKNEKGQFETRKAYKVKGDKNDKSKRS